MTQETLSALLDEECTAAELDQLLDQVGRDPALASRYSRMVLARESRASSIRAADPGFSSRVMAALAQELPPQASGATDKVRPFRAPRRAASAFKFSVGAPAFALALAASVAAVSVLVLRPDPAVNAPADVAATTLAAAGSVLGPTAGAVPEVNGGRSWDQLAPGDAEQLNAYLIAYSQSRAQQGMGSTLGYARYAAHTAEYRPQRIEGPSARPVAVRDPR